MGTAKVIDKGPGDKTVILNVRQKYRQGFEASNWVDLTIGFLLSLTSSGADDWSPGPSPNLAETIGTDPGLLGVTDRYWIGVKDDSAIMPHQTGSVFIGFTNESQENRVPTNGSSQLVSSDAAIGATNSDYWRAKNGSTGSSANKNWLMTDGIFVPAWGADNTQQHFVQNYAGGHAAGYATLLMLRLTRPDGNSKLITATTKAGTHATDVLFTSTPTEALLQANLESFPGTVQQLGPVTLSAVPAALYLYWPFHNSRLRIHAAGILQLA